MSARGVETHNGHTVFPEDVEIIISEETLTMHKISKIQVRRADGSLVILYE